MNQKHLHAQILLDSLIHILNNLLLIYIQILKHILLSFQLLEILFFHAVFSTIDFVFLSFVLDLRLALLF